MVKYNQKKRGQQGVLEMNFGRIHMKSSSMTLAARGTKTFQTNYQGGALVLIDFSFRIRLSKRQACFARGTVQLSLV